METSQDGFISTYARCDYELREDNCIFAEKLINVDESDLVNASNIL